MTKLKRFFGVCLLVVSMSVVALGDGQTQGPGIAQPPPPTESITTPAETQAFVSADFVTEATTILASWLEVVIF